MSMALSYAAALSHARGNRRNPPLGMPSQHSPVSLSSGEGRSTRLAGGVQDAMEGSPPPYIPPPTYAEVCPPVLRYNGKRYRFKGNGSYLKSCGAISKKHLRLPSSVVRRAFPELDQSLFGESCHGEKWVFKKNEDGHFFLVSSGFFFWGEAHIFIEEGCFFQRLVGAIQEKGVAPETVDVVWEGFTPWGS